jgi:shikimate dehydrogenase
MTYLSLRAPNWSQRDAPAAVLGAGGAARAVIYGFLQAGVGKVLVFNRSRARADEVANHFGARVTVHDWSQRSALARHAGVLVNATVLGMGGKTSPEVDFKGFDSDCVVSDIVYVPLATPFIRLAQAHGLRTVDGLGMLLYQAVPGFEKWFGVRPEVTDELYGRIAAGIEAGQ